MFENCLPRERCVEIRVGTRIILQLSMCILVCTVRGCFCFHVRFFSIKRERQLTFVYFCDKSVIFLQCYSTIVFINSKLRRQNNSQCKKLTVFMYVNAWTINFLQFGFRVFKSSAKLFAYLFPPNVRFRNTHRDARHFTIIVTVFFSFVRCVSFLRSFFSN